MKQVAASLALVASCLCAQAAASSPSTVSIWPRNTGDTLSYATNEHGVAIDALGGGVLASYTSQRILSTSDVTWHKSIRSIEIDIVPPTDLSSSTFERVVGASERFASVDSVGVHLLVELSPEDTALASNVSERNGDCQKQVEDSVRTLLKASFPSSAELVSPQADFLTRTPCRLQEWKHRDVQPLFKPTTDRVCLSSSHSISMEAARVMVASGIVDIPRVLQEETLRFAAATAAQSDAGIVVDYIQVALSPQTKFSIATRELEQRDWNAVIVSKVRVDGDAITLEYQAAPIVSSPSTYKLNQPSTVIQGTMAVALEGEGFHRHLAVQFAVADSADCQVPEQALLVLPLSHAAYADLDELRRMERFGHFGILAFVKHIEIERPSPVSPQHVIALALEVPPTRRLHVDIPIHLRYQAPSDSDLYRSTAIFAPEVFVYCPAPVNDIHGSPIADFDPVAEYFESWWGTHPSSGEHERGHRWRRLSLSTPVGVADALTPVGFLPSHALVSTVTLVSTCAASLLLVWISSRAKHAGGEHAAAARWEPKLE